MLDTAPKKFKKKELFFEGGKKIIVKLMLLPCIKL